MTKNSKSVLGALGVVTALVATFSMATLSSAGPKFDPNRKTEIEPTTGVTIYTDDGTVAPITQTADEPSPFMACQSDQEKKKNNEGCADCLKKNRNLIGDKGFAAIMKTMQTVSKNPAAADKQFLTGVISTVASHLDNNLSYMSKLKSCLGQAADSKGCKELAQAKDKLMHTALQYRHELAIANMEGMAVMKVNSGGQAPATMPPLSDLDIYEVKKPYVRVSAVIGSPVKNSVSGEFQDYELNMAQMVYSEETETIANTSKNGKQIDRTKASAALQDLRSKHAMKAASLIMQMPLLETLPAPTWTKDGSPAWSDQQLGDALGKLISNATKERKRAGEMLSVLQKDDSETYFETETGQLMDAKTGKALINKDTALKYMKYTPVVEDILNHNKQWCESAGRLSKQLGKKELIDNVVIGGGMLLAFGAGGIAGMPAVAMGVAGVTVGAGFVGMGMIDLNKAKQEVYVSAGTGEFEKFIQDRKVIEEAELNLGINLATMVPGTGMAGLAGKAYSNMVRSGQARNVANFVKEFKLAAKEMNLTHLLKSGKAVAGKEAGTGAKTEASVGATEAVVGATDARPVVPNKKLVNSVVAQMKKDDPAFAKLPKKKQQELAAASIAKQADAVHEASIPYDEILAKTKDMDPKLAAIASNDIYKADMAQIRNVLKDPSVGDPAFQKLSQKDQEKFLKYVMLKIDEREAGNPVMVKKMVGCVTACEGCEGVGLK